MEIYDLDDLDETRAVTAAPIQEVTQDVTDAIRTMHTALDTIRSTDHPSTFDRLSPTVITDIPAIATDVARAAATTGLVPEPTNSLDDMISWIEQNHEDLLNEEIPLPETPELANLPESDKRSFLIQINELIGQMLQMISQMTDRTRKKDDGQKKEYGVLNNEVGDAIESRGGTTAWSNIIALGMRMLGAPFHESGWGKALDSFGQQVPGLASLFTTGSEVTQSKSSNKLNMISTEMQKNAQSSGDNSGWKNELIQALNDVKSLWRDSVKNS